MDPLCRQPEKTEIAKTTVTGCRQRFKPNVTRASGRKEEPEKGAGNDKMSHPQPAEETEKVTGDNGLDKKLLDATAMLYFSFFLSFFSPEYDQDLATYLTCSDSVIWLRGLS